MFLVTGGTGFLGKYFVNLISQNEKVVVLSRLNNKSTDKNILIRTGDLSDINSLLSCTKNINGVIHLASVIHASNKIDYQNTNVIGTQNLIKACKINKIQRFIYISSANVKIDKTGSYANSKILAEECVINSKLDWTIVRPTIIYGKGDLRNFNKFNFILNTLPFFPIVGNGKFIFAPIFVEDLAKIINKMINNKISYKKIYEAGGEPITFVQFIKLLMKIKNKNKPILYLPKILLKLFIPIIKIISNNLSLSLEGFLKQSKGLTADTKELINDFNFIPTPLEKGLIKTFDNE